MEKLEKSGIGQDAHSNNVGIDPDTGEYIRFDIGAAYW
jgi:hypothetical protein